MNAPVYVKLNDGDPLPEDPMSYVVSRSGMFVCRRHPWFVSATRIRVWPPELGTQQEFLDASFPIIPRALFERVVGFFHCVAIEKQCEAGVYLIADRELGTVEARVPPQIATVRETRGGIHAIGLEYDRAPDLGPNEAVLGTIHSHVFEAAYASGIDVDDEADKPGLHLVVGRLDRAVPDFSIDAVVDGSRFRLELEDVVEGFVSARHDFPATWLERVEVEVLPSWSREW